MLRFNKRSNKFDDCSTTLAVYKKGMFMVRWWTSRTQFAAVHESFGIRILSSFMEILTIFTCTLHNSVNHARKCDTKPVDFIKVQQFDPNYSNKLAFWLFFKLSSSYLVVRSDYWVKIILCKLLDLLSWFLLTRCWIFFLAEPIPQTSKF